MTELSLEAGQALAFVLQAGPTSTRAVRRAVCARARRVDSALLALRDAGLVSRSPDGWVAARGARDALGHGSGRSGPSGLQLPWRTTVQYVAMLLHEGGAYGSYGAAVRAAEQGLAGLLSELQRARLDARS